MIRTASIVLIAAAGFASAGIVSPFTETFDTDNSGWRDGPQSPAAWNAGGSISGSGDVNSAGAFGLLIFRAQDEYGSSGGAFIGDYITSGINSISFDIRHDAGIDLTFAVRFSTVNNSPAFVIFSDQAVSSGSWTTVTLAISADAPGYTPAGGTFESVAPQIGHVQILVSRPADLTAPLPTNFDLDNVSIVPAPGAIALLGLGGLAATRRRRA